MADPDPQRTSLPLASMLQEGADQVHVRAKGLEHHRWNDIYHRLVRASWPRVIALAVGIFIGANVIFAGAFALDVGGVNTLSGPNVSSLYLKMFFFSVETMATVGYGNMYPVSAMANWLVVGDVVFGLLFTALATGIAFARFSRPTAQILFSGVAVVNEVGGVPMLMFRAANQRHNLILEATARVSLLVDEDIGGVTYRRFKDLCLERAATPLFTLSWTLMHPVDETSPLRPWIENRDVPSDAEIVIVLSGTDIHTGQLIHARWAYAQKDIRWNARFADILKFGKDGVRVIDYAKFHDVVAVPPAGQAAP